MAHALPVFLITTKYIRCKLLLLKLKKAGNERMFGSINTSIDLNAFV